MACSPGDRAPADGINDPGAAPYGNFINYYSFNPPENRLSLIPASLLHELGYGDERQTTLILDVGCNSGVRRRKCTDTFVLTADFLIYIFRQTRS